MRIQYRHAAFRRTNGKTCSVCGNAVAKRKNRTRHRKDCRGRGRG